MPQFDFFIWFSLSLGTIITFQFLYYFTLYYILAPFADLQKTLIKLYALKQLRETYGKSSPFEYLSATYFQKAKKKYSLTDIPLLKKNNILILNTLKIKLKKKIKFVTFSKNKIKLKNSLKPAILSIIPFNASIPTLKSTVKIKKASKKASNKESKKGKDPKKTSKKISKKKLNLL